MKSVGPLALRGLVTLLAVLATVAQVAYLDALAWHALGLASPLGARLSGSLLTLLTAHAVVSVASAVLAVALVLHEGRRQAAARMLGLALGAWSYITAYSGVTLLLRPTPGLGRTLFDAHFLLVEMAGLAGILRFSALFPSGARPAEPPGPDGRLGPLRAPLAWMQRPASPVIAAAVTLGLLWGWTAARGLPAEDAGLSPVADLARFAAAGLVVWNLRQAWVRASEEEAERLGWLLLALVVLLSAVLLLIGGNVLVAVTGWSEPAVNWRPLILDLGVVGFLGALALSVLDRGARDARGAARRVAAFTAVAALGLFLAAALEALFTGSVLAGISLRSGVGTVLAATVVISTHRGLVRAVERGLRQADDVLERAA